MFTAIAALGHVCGRRCRMPMLPSRRRMTHRTIRVVRVVAACGGESNPPPSSAIPDACNPLGGQGCLLPWPSQTYTAADPSTATQLRLDLPADGMPVNTPGVPVDPAPFNARWDGFSPTGPMLAMFPDGVSSDGLPSFKNPDESLAPGSPIVVLDLDRGERAAFFAEVDQNVSDVPSRALVIRPLVRLHEKTHYAVAIRNKIGRAHV